MLNAFANLLCLKLCQHNWCKPRREGNKRLIEHLILGAKLPEKSPSFIVMRAHMTKMF